MPVVTGSQGPDQPAEILIVARVLRIDAPALIAARFLRPHHLPVPGRDIPLRTAAIGCDPQQEGLASLGGGFQGLVEHVPVVFSHFRLHELPVNAEIGGRGSRVVRVFETAPERLVVDRETLSPAISRIECVAVEALEGVEADPGIDQNLIALLRTYDYRVLGEKRRIAEDQNGEAGLTENAHCTSLVC